MWGEVKPQHVVCGFTSGEKRRSNLVRQKNSIATDSIEVADARRVENRHFIDYPFNRLAFLLYLISCLSARKMEQKSISIASW